MLFAEEEEEDGEYKSPEEAALDVKWSFRADGATESLRLGDSACRACDSSC